MKVKTFKRGQTLVYVMHATRARNVNQKKYYALVKQFCGPKGLEELIRLRKELLPGQAWIGYLEGYLEATRVDGTKVFNSVFFTGGVGKDQILEGIVVSAPTHEELRACLENLYETRLNDIPADIRINPALN
jgi:hypothetical protein